MLKQTLIALLILITYSNAKAQDKSAMYSNAVDYANCKLTYTYLNQFTSSLPADKAEKKSFDYIKSQFGNGEIGNSISYSKLSEILNGNNFKYSNQKFSAVIDEIKKAPRLLFVRGLSIWCHSVPAFRYGKQEESVEQKLLFSGWRYRMTRTLYRCLFMSHQFAQVNQSITHSTQSCVNTAIGSCCNFFKTHIGKMA